MDLCDIYIYIWSWSRSPIAVVRKRNAPGLSRKCGERYNSDAVPSHVASGVPNFICPDMQSYECLFKLELPRIARKSLWGGVGCGATANQSHCAGSTPRHHPPSGTEYCYGLTSAVTAASIVRKKEKWWQLWLKRNADLAGINTRTFAPCRIALILQ